MHGDVFLISNLSSAHFVQLCDSRDIPIVFLPNSGDRTAEEAFASDNIMALKERGKMAQCVANARVPKVGQLILPYNPYFYIFFFLPYTAMNFSAYIYLEMFIL